MHPKYFKKSHGIIWGLDPKSLVKIIISYLILISTGLYLKLSPAHPLFIFLAILATIVTAFIIKVSREDEIRGFYSSLVFHPLKDLIYTEASTSEPYSSIKKLFPIKAIDQDTIINHRQDRINIIKLKHGFCFNRASQEETTRIINEWQNLLIEMHKINSLDSYFFINQQVGQALQIFINASPYQYPEAFISNSSELNLTQASKIHQAWYENFTQSQKFTPALEFYIIVKETNPNISNKPLKALVNKLCPVLFQDINLIKETDLDEQIKMLKQKSSNILDFCSGINLEANILDHDELRRFVVTWLQNESIGPDSYLQDRGKFLENNHSRYALSKTYRLQELPEKSKNSFWLWDLILRLQCQTSISIMLETRNPQADRRKAESNIKYSLRKPLETGLKRIEENKNIYSELSDNPYSFDLSIHITVYCQSLRQLEKIDQQIKKPLNSARVSGLDRMQISNYYSSLPFCTSSLRDADKIFTTLEPLKSSFALIDTRLGTKTGPLLGIAQSDNKPVYLDEYNRDYFHNRAINFIGDSGSGKTVAAKLAIKRRIHDPARSFFVIDNTEDGWEFFTNYFGGHKIDIDQSTNSKSEALFAPLTLASGIDINDHLDKCFDLFALLQNSDTKLSYDERNFWTTTLQEFYRPTHQRSLSDLILFLESYPQSQISEKWLKIFTPYSRIKNGVYAGLLDSDICKISGQLVLFTFSKIKTNSLYQDASIYLISDFLASTIKQQAKTTLVIDEAWKIFKNSKNNSGKELLCHLARAGRGLDLGLWTISQKPSDLPSEIHSSASASLCFQLKEKQDRLDMIRFASLNDREEELINSIHLSRSGNAFFKTTIDSGIVHMSLDPLEEILCNSVREFSNTRKDLYRQYLDLHHDPQTAALMTATNLLNHVTKYQQI